MSPRKLILEARRTRARRALAFAGLVRIALVGAIGFALHAEPDMRHALYAAGSEVIMGTMARGALPPVTELAVVDTAETTPLTPPVATP